METKPSSIAYILATRFPTEKAYGITTRETINSLVNLDIRTRLFCLESSFVDSDDQIKSEIHNLQESGLSKLLRKFSLTCFKKIGAIFWVLSLISLLLNNLKVIRIYNPSLIWTRNPIIAYFFSKYLPFCKIVLEVHETNLKFFLKKILKNPKNIKVFFTNSQLLQSFSRDGSKENLSFLAPLGIRSDSLTTQLECNDFLANLKHRKHFMVGYIGGFTAGGYSKGVEDLIFMAEYAQRNKFPISIVLIGATESEKLYFDALTRDLGIQESFLDIKLRVPHSKALKLMKTFDVLILPAPKSNSYDGVPLKLLEYFAAGRITLIADTKLNREILPNDLNNFFYSPSDYENTWLLIKNAINSGELSQRIFKSVDYSSKFTWDIRTRNILATVNQS